jgi:hypothetical protein
VDAYHGVLVLLLALFPFVPKYLSYDGHKRDSPVLCYLVLVALGEQEPILELW